MNKIHILSIIVFLSSIGGYILSRNSIKNKVFEKDIVYTSTEASEIYMAWGLMGQELPSSDIWPDSSYTKDDMIWSKMVKKGQTFTTSIREKENQFFITGWCIQKI